MSQSKAAETLLFLADYNSWRRGEVSIMPNPAEIGAAIDDAVNLLRRQAELERELDRAKEELKKCCVCRARRRRRQSPAGKVLD